MAPVKRKSYTREKKLEVVAWFFENGRNVSKTASHFSIHRKQISCWVKEENLIREQKRNSKSRRKRGAKFPSMESKLHQEFLQLRKEGKSAKHWWFTSRARQFMQELHPDKADDFKYSDRWFQRFCKRYGISLRRKTHTSQKAPSDLRKPIENFHAKLLRERKRGTYKLADLANMDQTPLPFVLEDNKTYATKGSDEIWCATGSSGLDKRQCTVQLTIFANGSAHVPPLLIFRGKGMRINQEERRKWDKRVSVKFQEKAWCDERIMKDWISEHWGNTLVNPKTVGSDGKILFADVHTAQQTQAVKIMLRKCDTTLINVPPGTTSRVQPLDVAINKPFKTYVREQFEKHLNENLQLYLENKLTAGDRRILTTKWVANAWQKVKQNKDLIIRSFLKCGISNSLDGSEDHLVNIRGLEDYIMPKPESEFHLMSDDDDDDSESSDTDGVEYEQSDVRSDISSDDSTTDED